MQSFAVILSALFAIAAQAAPAPDTPEVGSIVPKAVSARTCSITGNGVNYRSYPNSDNSKNPSHGQYFYGDKVYFTCVTTEKNTVNIYWALTGSGYYVSYKYIDSDCGNKIPWC